MKLKCTGVNHQPTTQQQRQGETIVQVAIKMLHVNFVPADEDETAASCHITLQIPNPSPETIIKFATQDIFDSGELCPVPIPPPAAAPAPAAKTVPNA